MTGFSVKRPGLLTGLMVAATMVVALLALLPTLLPEWTGGLNRITVDTDPENMLREDEPVRVFHDRMKERFALNDMVVVGVVNPEHPDGVFNPQTLTKIWKLTGFAESLHFDANGQVVGKIPKLPADYRDGNAPQPASGDESTAPPPAPEGLPEGLGEGGGPALPAGMGGGEPSPEPKEESEPDEPTGQEGPTRGAADEIVVERDIIAPSTVDKIIPTPGSLKFNWLMRHPPRTQEGAIDVRKAARRIPFLNGTMVSEDGRMIAVYLPLTKKDLSHDVYVRLQEIIGDLGGPEEYHITGLPVAEDTFGFEMFVQMAISAPTAMVVIFLLMLVFFRKLVLIISPMIVALVCTVLTMGALVIAGYPVHIMSSMIPIFIMPIAVLDSIHIISEFFEKYQETRDRRTTLYAVMDALFVPMLYTSLTSAAGFASLALTPIPPVQVFGVFVAMGILAAWLLTVTFIPAFVMFIPESRLEGFGAKHDRSAGQAHPGLIGRFLNAVGHGTYRFAKPIVALTVVVLVIAGWGISQINVNDNPVKWFEPSHPIRRADRVLNDHFGGTYMAYLSLEAQPRKWQPQETLAEMRRAVDGQRDPNVRAALDELTQAAETHADANSPDAFFRALHSEADRVSPRGMADELDTFVNRRRQAYFDTLKDPETLRWLAQLQEHLLTVENRGKKVVGKSNSIADIVRTINRDLHASSPTYIPPRKDPNYVVPDNAAGVAQTLLQYENSHRPHDLWHLITKDYRNASVWVQLTSGDNEDMSAVVKAVDEWIGKNPPPRALEHKWFGLTYINVVWQEKMVWGMLQSFAGSFLVVFLLMTILFRSALWGLLSMVPLTVTIAAIYGALGIVGKDYDMPTAVLSSLTLGLAVDFAIHFLARSRAMYLETGSWKQTAPKVFGEPARAIARNIIVIAAGFLPLLLAPLVPYQTVGMLLATILVVSGLATLLILPALVRLLEGPLFQAAKSKAGPTCVCGTCVAVSAAAVALLALNAYQYLAIPLGALTIIALIAVPLAAVGCALLGRRDRCNIKQPQQEVTHEDAP
jgi:hypothetical protein